MAATLDGTFRLIDRASGTLDRIAKRASAADRNLRQLGRSIDVVERKTRVLRTRVRELDKSLENLSRRRATPKIELAGAQEAEAALTGLNTRLDALNRRSTNPKIELAGMQQAEVALAAFDSQLDSLNRRRTNPKVELDGVAGTLASIAAVNAALSSLDRNASVSMRIVGGAGVMAARSMGTVEQQATRTGKAVTSVGGQFSLLTSHFAVMAAGAAALSPLILQLAGAVTALASSLAFAVGGAALVGGGLLGAFAVGLGSVFAIAKSSLGPLKAYQTAIKNLNTAMASGDPRRIQQAQKLVDQLAAKSPQLAKFNVELTKTQKAWQSFVTRGMRERFFGFASDWLGTARNMLHRYRHEMDLNASSVYKALEPVRKFLASREFEDFIRRLSYTFRQVIGPVIHGVLGYVRGFMSLVKEALPTVRALAGHFGTMGDNFAKWARGSGGKRAVRDMLASFKEWRRLLSSTWNLLKAIFAPARSAGDSMVGSLSKTFNRWAENLRRDPGAVQRWFKGVASEVSNLATSLAKLIGQIASMANALRPLTGILSTLIGNLGLPGIAMAVGGGILAKGALTGRGMRFGLGLPSRATQRAAATSVIGGRMTAAEPPVVPGAGATRGYSPTLPFLPGAAAERTGTEAATGAGTRANPYLMPATYEDERAARLAARRAAVTSQGGRYGRVANTLLRPFGAAEGPGVFTGSRAALGGALRTPQAGGAMALGSTILGGYLSQSGNDTVSRAGDALGMAGTGAMIGSMVPGVGTAVGAATGLLAGGVMGALRGPDRGKQSAKDAAAMDDFLKGLGTARGPQGVRQQMNALRDLRDDPRRRHNRTADQIKAQTDAINAEIQARKELIPQLAAERAVRSRGKGQAMGADLQKAFNITAKRFGTERAMQELASGTLQHMSGRKFSGARQVAEAGLEAAREAARQNPKLEGEYEKLRKRVNKKFSDMGRNVVVVGTQIKAAATRDWPRIKEAIAQPSERAAERASKAFTSIQKAAIGALEDMGFSRPSAVNFVKQAEGKGGTSGLPSGSAAGATGTLGPVGAQGAPSSTGAASLGISDGGAFTPFGDGPGALPRWGGTARDSGHNNSGTGELMGANANLMPYAAVGERYGLAVSSGLRPGAITTSGGVSYHASGHAIDMSGSAQAMMAYATYMAQTYGSGLEELIHTPLGYGIKDGRRVPLSYWGPTINAMHMNHVHVADTAPGGVQGAAGGVVPGLMGPGGAMPQVSLPRQTVEGPVPDSMAALAYNSITAGLENKINSALLGGLPGQGGGLTAAGGAYNKGALANLWTQAGGPPGVANLMAAVALAESGGNPKAHNPSGASGLWQILGVPFKGNVWNPLTNAKMAVAKYQSQGLGAWEAYTNGMYQAYMGDGTGRFGGWHADGGTATYDRPTYIGVAERGKETVTVTPAQAGGKGHHGGIHIQHLEVHGGDNVKDAVMEAFRDLARELNMSGPEEG